MALAFTPVESFFDPGFWSQFYDNKLEVYKLDDSGVPLLLQYGTSPHASLAPKLSAYGEFSFNTAHRVGNQSSASPCTLFNFNSFQGFKDCDKKALLLEQSGKIWQDMLQDNVSKQPSLLNQSFIISYADLKQYLYTHWLCTPALQPQGFTFNIVKQVEIENYSFSSSSLISSPTTTTLPLLEYAQVLAQMADLTQHPVFAINKAEKKALTMEMVGQVLQDQTTHAQFLQDHMFVYLDPVAAPDAMGWFAKNILLYIMIMLGSYGVPSGGDDGYQIDFLAIKNTRPLQVSYQELLQANPQQANPQHQQQSHTSIVYTIQLGGKASLGEAIAYARAYRQEPTITTAPLPPTPSSLGWEKYKNKPQPKQSSAKNLDPLQIYSQAGDMNLKLLKWQHWPEMPLPHIRNQKCLLIGSGTLGCYVSRLLLGWGVGNITMLDYGKVSASNPVRQPLFTYKDWQDKKNKADAACDALRAIHPRANLLPVVLSVPSAGTVSEAEMDGALDSAKKLAELIQCNDVIFLLTDSRASRWLPTLMAQAYGKRTIAAAIGPETYVAMRHGIRQGWEYTKEMNTSTKTIDWHELKTKLEQEQDPTEGSKKQDPIIGFGTFTNQPHDINTSGTLSCGCYFCPDQAAPILGIPQSIDQQCTVTRAEVAAIASSYATNLFVHDVSHKCSYHLCKNEMDGDKVPEEGNGDDTDGDDDGKPKSLFTTPTTCETCELHSQIRGSVLTHVNPTIDSNSLSCPPSETCVACGYQIIKSYQKDPVGFLTAAFTDAENVIKMSGFNPNFDGGSWEDDDWDADGEDGIEDEDDF